MVVLLGLLAAQALAGGFRCDLNALPFLPPILLIGENHCNDHSISVKKEAARFAAQGLIAGGFEGVYPGTEAEALRTVKIPQSANPRFFGIENSFTHGLIGSYFAAQVQPVCESTTEEVVESSLYLLADNEHARQAWKQVVQSGGAAGFGLPARLLESAASGRVPTIEEILRMNNAELDALLLLFRRINGRYVAMANERLGELGLTRPLVPLPETLSRHPSLREDLHNQRVDDSIEQVIIPVRDREMAASIEDIYCAAAADGIGTAAVIGYAHHPGIAAILARDSDRRVPVFTPRSDRDSAYVLQMLRDMAQMRRPSRGAAR